jgi:hypothetical protein
MPMILFVCNNEQAAFMILASTFDLMAVISSIQYVSSSIVLLTCQKLSSKSQLHVFSLSAGLRPIDVRSSRRRAGQP